MSFWVQVIVLIALLAVVVLQLFYHIYFFVRFMRHKPVQPVTNAHLPLSIIVCARDEYKNLKENIPQLASQDYAPYELLVIDDVSFDDTPTYLQEAKSSFNNLQYVRIKNEGFMPPGKKYPLALGLKSARNEYVALTDADCTPVSNQWLQYIAAHFEAGKEVVLGYSPYIAEKGFLNICIRYETIITALQYFSYAMAGLPYMGVGRNLAYHKKLFFEQKGFAAHIHIPSGDDDLFIQQIATKDNIGINLHANSFMYSKPATSWRQWIKQKTRHYGAGQLYKPRFKLLLAGFSISWALLYPLGIIALCTSYAYIAAGALGLRFIFHGIIMWQTCKKLQEKGIFVWFWLFDIGMLLYYGFFAIALLKKPKRTWK
jgi:glycosyltransferase involved in cell wall biosynthesis